MEEHAATVAARWGKKRAAAIADGMKPDAFDAHMLAFMRWGGWDEQTAQAICRRAQRISEKEYCATDCAPNEKGENELWK